MFFILSRDARIFLGKLAAVTQRLEWIEKKLDHLHDVHFGLGSPEGEDDDDLTSSERREIRDTAARARAAAKECETLEKMLGKPPKEPGA